ncbi:MAG: hypothetical protein AB1568_04765 [Thermodesulfobacteriota bacterium]
MPIQIVREEERLTYSAHGSKIHYRRMSSLKRSALIRQHTRRGVVDWGAVTAAILRWIVLGWDGVQSGGADIPFDPELVPCLPEEITTELLDLATGAEEDREDTEKN